MHTTDTPAAHMLLLDEIPPGAEFTVTLHNGKSFTGTEDTRDDDRARGLLRMSCDLGHSETMIFYTTADQISSFSMVIQ